MTDPNTLFWVFLAAVVILAAYFFCNKGGSREGFKDLKRALGLRADTKSESPTPVQVQEIELDPTGLGSSAFGPVRTRSAELRRQNVLQVEHNDPLLLTLFTKEVHLLPDGVTQEQFDRLVDEHYNKFIKTPELQIPRSLNFNYDKYAEDQDRVARETNSHYQQFIQRDDVGSLTEQVNRNVTQKLHVKSFLKKKSKGK